MNVLWAIMLGSAVSSGTTSAPVEETPRAIEDCETSRAAKEGPKLSALGNDLKDEAAEDKVLQRLGLKKPETRPAKLKSSPANQAMETCK